VSEASASTRRTTFYDELIRRRRAAWIVASVCALVSAGVGLVLSTIVTPIVLLVVGGFLKLVAALGVVDSLALGGIALIHDFVATQLANFDRLSRTLDRVNGLGDIALLAEPLTRLAPAALPALFAGMLVWLWLRGLFGRSSSQDLITRVKARPANLDDFEERQLGNIVEEVAIGAGAPPPLLFLIDTPTVNAAALGAHDKGIVLFTRGMLDRLDRSETEAVAARLISAIGAGDLRAAAGIMAVFRTLGFFLTVLDLPLRWSAWRTLGGLMLVSLTRRTVPGGEAFAYLFIAAPTTARRAVTDRRTLAMALMPRTSKRLARLSAMGANPRGGRTFDLAALAAHPLRAFVVGALALLLVPLFVALVVAIGFLTAVVMTFGLLAGLGIVHALI